MNKKNLTHISLSSRPSKIAIPILVVLLLVISYQVSNWIFKTTNAGAFASHRANLRDLLAFFIVPPLTIIAHELIHAFFFFVFKGRPKFGAGVMYKILPYFTTSSSGLRLKLWQMIAVGLSPLVLLDTAGISLMYLWPKLFLYGSTIFVINTIGACADIWLVTTMLVLSSRYQKPVVVDRGDNFVLFDSAPPGSRMI